MTMGTLKLAKTLIVSRACLVMLCGETCAVAGAPAGLLCRRAFMARLRRELKQAPMSPPPQETMMRKGSCWNHSKLARSAMPWKLSTPFFHLQAPGSSGWVASRPAH